ncbi:Serine/threonine-protein phosphatase 2A activator 1 like [Verticillium longisporum]|nr:Serine/threonine-protein phosphatase 2A activator 1 like [Verticillium longisporum]
MDPPPPPAGATSPHPCLTKLDPSTPHTFQPPVKRINEGPDVSTFLKSKAHRDITTFVLQLNRSLCPELIPATSSTKESIKTYPSTSVPPAADLPPQILALQSLLRSSEALIAEAPPDPGPRRFGNASFRTWSKLLESHAPTLLTNLLPPEILNFGGSSPLPELQAYFLGSFGSPQRLDYGTGHELSFLAFLGGLYKLNFFPSSPSSSPGDTERLIALAVLGPYLSLVRTLIKTYTLEPAGSHGVWGLDDHAFLPYILGSAQLSRAVPASSPMPQEGSVRGAPRPADVARPDAVDADRRAANLYFAAVGFINDVKTGPFWEHSPLLFDISGIRDGWAKINKGMLKMFAAEVLAKFPVVQHFPFGALFAWDRDPDAPPPVASVHLAHQPPMAAPQGGAAAAPAAVGAGFAASALAGRGSAPVGPGGTPAPWAAGSGAPPTSRTPGGAGMRAPWAGSAGRVPQPPPPPPSSRGAGEGSGSSDPQITMTKAPWAK